MTEAQEKRCDELYALHMKWNGKEYIGCSKFNKDFNVHWTEISCDTDKVFNAKIKKLKKSLNERIDKILWEFYSINFHINPYTDMDKHNKGISKALKKVLLMDIYNLDDI